MAMRMAVRRWPGASQVRSMMRSGRQQEQQLQQSRAYADEVYTGKGLDEKEKAAENRYIRQKEEEAKLKKAAAGEASQTAAGIESVASTVSKATASADSGGFRNTAVVAGIIAAVAGYWLLSSSGSPKKAEKESN
ncbi:unnamed protein product [Calypogeia fissa]